jgi:hypothetical protein
MSIGPAGVPSSGIHKCSSVELRMNISSPPGRNKRAAAGIQTYGSHQSAASCSLIALSKLASRNGICLALA